MKQSSFSDTEFAHKKKQTLRDGFLAEIEAVTTWALWFPHCCRTTRRMAAALAEA
jgi:hypothetical protein